jgi:hypothetical protein
MSSPERALIGVSIVVLLSTILCIPSYLEQCIVEVYLNDTSPSSNNSKITIAYRFEETSFSKSLSLRGTVFVLHSVIFKLMPCIFLLLFSFLLIQQLRNALQQSEILHRHTSIKKTSSINNGRIRGRRRETENRRTTLMLVIVCVLFLVTELPQGAILLLAFLSKTKSTYYYQIYQHLGKYFFSRNKHNVILSCLGDTFDILALINNSVNFLLYCFMSRAFRNTFKQTFCFLKKTIDRRRSTSSYAPVIITRHLQRHTNQSITYDTVLTHSCSDAYRTSLTPIIKSLSDNPNKRKKRTSKSLQILNYTNSVS